MGDGLRYSIEVYESFEETLKSVTADQPTSSFHFDDTELTFSRAVRSAIPVTFDHAGVYVIRDATGDVLYVGKAGSIRTDGSFKRQVIRGRLTAPRGATGNADAYFAEVLERFGPIDITAIGFGDCPAPALIEAVLLQAFLDEFGRLPPLNNAF